MGRRFYSLTAAAAIVLLCDPSLIPEPTTTPSPRAEAGAAAVPGACPGRAIKPTRVITGTFGPERVHSYVMVPFEVPRGTTAVRVKYCFDQADIPVVETPVVSARNTLDLGLYAPRKGTSRVWGVPEFRGWGGSSHPDVTVSAQGFSTEAQYVAKPRVDPPGKTTRAFRPGPIVPGEWAVELGVAGIVPPALGNLDGKVAWRVELELARDPAFGRDRYKPAAYDRTPARSGPGWYAGDMHVHAEHSAYGDATMREAFDYAFKPLAKGGAGLDFVTLSDYVSGSAWGEIGRHQGRYPGHLIGRSAEVITYRGHLNNHESARVVDYREGPIYERAASGSLRQIRGSRDPKDTFRDIRAGGGFTQINHPTIFPASVPVFDLFCRGCSWEYSRDETNYRQADAIEVGTGTSGLDALGGVGPNPFTVTAIGFYERALDTGAKVAAVGVSDSHKAGRVSDPVLGAPIGEATTVVHAEELSEPGIECGVKAGHTYAKIAGNKGPDLRFEAVPPGWTGNPAIFGDTVRGGAATFKLRIISGPGRQVSVIRNGGLYRLFEATSADQTFTFPSGGLGRYRIQVARGTTIEAVSSPIYVEAGGSGVERRDCSPLRVSGKVAKRVRGARFVTRCAASGARVRPCSVTATIATGRGAKRRVRTIGTGRARAPAGSRRVVVRLNRYGRALARKQSGRGRAIRLVFTVDDGDGATRTAEHRARLLR